MGVSLRAVLKFGQKLFWVEVHRRSFHRFMRFIPLRGIKKDRLVELCGKLRERTNPGEGIHKMGSRFYVYARGGRYQGSFGTLDEARRARC